MVIEQRIIFIWTLVIFMSLPTLSKIYFVTFRHHNAESRESNEINLLREANRGTHSRSFLEKLVSILTQNRTQHVPTTKNRCVAHFGSMYGPHGHRQRCLESSKKKTVMSSLLPNDYLYKEFHQWHYEPFHYDDVMYYEHEYPFLDFTENEGPKSLSDDIRSSTNEDSRSESPMAILLLTGYRRNYQRVGVTKRNMNVHTSEEIDDEKENSDVSDTSSGSSDEDSFTETEESEKQIENPKRFQVIDNHKVSMSKDKPNYEVASDENSQSTDTDGELAESNNKKKTKRMKRKRVKKTKKADQQATENEFYLQGNKYLDPRSVPKDDLRKRLQSFLPKRYHWKDDEIHDLGYYWFNGPQGRYPHYAVRP